MEKQTFSPGPAVDDVELSISGGGRLHEDNINFNPKRSQQVRVIITGEIAGYSETGKHTQAGLVTTANWKVKAESIEIIELVRHAASGTAPLFGENGEATSEGEGTASDEPGVVDAEVVAELPAGDEPAAETYAPRFADGEWDASDIDKRRLAAAIVDQIDSMLEAQANATTEDESLKASESLGRLEDYLESELELHHRFPDAETDDVQPVETLPPAVEDDPGATDDSLAAMAAQDNSVVYPPNGTRWASPSSPEEWVEVIAPLPTASEEPAKVIAQSEAGAQMPVPVSAFDGTTLVQVGARPEPDPDVDVVLPTADPEDVGGERGVPVDPRNDATQQPQPSAANGPVSPDDDPSTAFEA